MADVTVLATTYTVSALPEDHPDRRHFEILLKRRPGDRWAVCTHFDQYCDDQGRFSYPDREGIDDAWKVRHWHTWDRAVDLASTSARSMTCNGWTVADVLAKHRTAGEPQ